MAARVRSRSALLALLLIGCGGPSDEGERASDPPHTEPASARPQRAADVMDASDFLVRVHDFNWEIQGSTVYALEASGALTYIYPRMQAGPDGVQRILWLEARTTLTQRDVAALRRLARAVPGLEARYVDPDLADGAIATFWLRAHGELTEVYCQNRCADEAMQILQWLRVRAEAIGEPHRQLDEGQAPGMRWDGDE